MVAFVWVEIEVSWSRLMCFSQSSVLNTQKEVGFDKNGLTVVDLSYVELLALA